MVIFFFNYYTNPFSFAIIGYIERIYFIFTFFCPLICSRPFKAEFVGVGCKDLEGYFCFILSLFFILFFSFIVLRLDERVTPLHLVSLKNVNLIDGVDV